MYLRGDEAHEYNQNMAYNSQRTTKASNFFYLFVFQVYSKFFPIEVYWPLRYKTMCRNFKWLSAFEFMSWDCQCSDSFNSSNRAQISVCCTGFSSFCFVSYVPVLAFRCQFCICQISYNFCYFLNLNTIFPFFSVLLV